MLIFLFLAIQRPVWDNGISLHLLNITILALMPIQGAVEVQDFCKIMALFLSLFPSNVKQLLCHILHSLTLNTKNAVDKRPSLYQQFNWNPIIATLTLHRRQHLLGFSINFTTQTPGNIIRQTKSTHLVIILVIRHSNLRAF
jgi:hypothetical protein